jgi:hypothetical protein
MSAFLAWRLGGKVALRAGFYFQYTNSNDKKLRLLAGDQAQLEYTSPPPPSLMRYVIVLSPSESSGQLRNTHVS